MYIEKATEVTEELYNAVKTLVSQLGTHNVSSKRVELGELLHSESSTLLIARFPDESGAIAGILTLVLYRVPTGVRCIVEDVVVDEKLRRRGIAEALLRHAIDVAREAGANGVALTSNPRREAANQLYRVLGFQLRETNAYLYKFE